MKITVLGSGGFGYPLAFCDCEYCAEARKLKGKNIRKRASILINDEMLVDLTPDAQTSMNMYDKDMSKVDYLLQTHTHLDHFDLNLFITLDYKYAIKKENKLNLVCSKLCLDDIQQKLLMYEKMNLFDAEYLKKIKLATNVLNHGESLDFEKYQIKAIHCLHHKEIGTQNYLIKSEGKTLLYATDTPPITEQAINELAGEKIDCIFLDESFGVNDYMFAHLNIKGFCEYVDTLKKNNLVAENCKIYATHLTHDGNPLHDELQKIFDEYGYFVAYDGMEIEI